jgi:1-deoxy-D-xylulose-5-phosphate synthase
MASVAVEAAKHLQDAGHRVTVVDPRWIKPLNPAVISMAAEHSLVITVEDNGRQGGVGETLAAALAQRGYRGDILVRAVDQQFLTHAKRDVVLGQHGLTAAAIAADAVEHLDSGKR